MADQDDGMWFKNETNLVTMMDLVKFLKEELEKNSLHKTHVQNAMARLEATLLRKPLAKAHALFFKERKEMKGGSLK